MSNSKRLDIKLAGATPAIRAAVAASVQRLLLLHGFEDVTMSLDSDLPEGAGAGDCWMPPAQRKTQPIQISTEKE